MPSTQNRTIDGPAGPLEARVAAGSSRDKLDSNAPQAVLCHPHPLYGGSMDDAVLGALSGPLQQAGYDVWRFNFRGVGGSAGIHDGHGAEADDVRAVLSAVRANQTAKAPLLLGGYSFGAAMAWAAADAATIDELWLVAPPLGVMAFDTRPLEAALQLWLGSQDAYCAEEDARAFVRGTGAGNHQALAVLTGANHVFSGALEELGGLAAARLADQSLQ